MIVIGLAAVGNVDAPHPDAIAGCANRTRFECAFVLRLVSKTDGDVGKTDLAQQCHAIPATGAPGRDLIAEGLNLHQWESGVSALEFLKGQHIRLVQF